MGRRESKFPRELYLLVWLGNNREIKHVENRYELNYIFPNFICWCPTPMMWLWSYLEGKCWHRDVYREKVMWRRQRPDWCVNKPRNVKDCQKLPETSPEMEWILLPSFSRKEHLPAPWFQISNSQNCEIINFSCLSLLVCDTLLEEPQPIQQVKLCGS